MSALSLAEGIAKLRQHAESVLRAELAAILHDVGKATAYYREVAAITAADERSPRLNAIHFVAGRLLDLIPTHHRAASHLSFGQKPSIEDLRRVEKEFSSEFKTAANSTTIRLPAPLDDREYTMSDLIELHKIKEIDLRNIITGTAHLVDLMYCSHMQAKGLEARAFEQEQRESKERRRSQIQPELSPQLAPWYKASVFGHELPLSSPCASQIRPSLDSASLRSLLCGQLADSRRPINDVSLANIGYSAAAFLKAAIAHCVLLQEIPSVLTWCLLRIAVNGPEFWSASERIPDILVRRDILTNLLDFVRDGFEREWLIGNEVYRDDYGSTFLLPGLMQNSAYKVDIEALVRKRWKDFGSTHPWHGPISGELSFQPIFSSDFAVGPHGAFSFVLGPLLEVKPPPPQADPQQVSAWWQGRNRSEVCTVCRLRPMGGTHKAARRKVCQICEERRQERSRGWLDNPTHSIWTEEVADANGRVAAVVARFRLEGWLRNGGCIESTLRLGRKGNEDLFKTPSFARISRVWETTSDFWRSGLDAIESSLRLTSRVCVRGSFTRLTDRPVPGHAYFLLSRAGARFGVVCSSHGDTGTEFVLAENLARACKLYGLVDPEKSGMADCAALLAAHLGESAFVVQEPGGYGSPEVEIGSFTGLASKVPVASGTTEGYSPIIRILDNPTMLMFLAPAQHAFTLANILRHKYEIEMARVRDRLPIDIGIVYASAANPAYALINAAQTLINGLRRSTQTWQLERNVEQVGADFQIRFTNGVTWTYPVFMEDKKTIDSWYPYLRTNNGLVHVKALKKNDKVLIEPSHFDFEFLDSSGRRFEIAYDSNGKRRMPDVAQRPHLLEDVPKIRSLWTILHSGLDKNQIRELDGLLAAKRAEWQGQLDEAFAEWAVFTRYWHPDTPRSAKDEVVAAAQSGLLHDVVEIHFGLERDRPR